MRGDLIGQYDLWDRQSGRFVDAELRGPVSDGHVEDFEKQWRPIFDSRIAELKALGKDTLADFGSQDLQDAHWDWASKTGDRAKRLEWESYAVEADGITQGLMFVRTAGFARESSQARKPLVEIDLLATAPWNRPRLVPSPRYKGVGRLLLATAVNLSFNEEFSGRVGLHALPQAESWYRDVCKMTDLGPDGTKMHYFEMTESQARAFLGLR